MLPTDVGPTAACRAGRVSAAVEPRLLRPVLALGGGARPPSAASAAAGHLLGERRVPRTLASLLILK